MSGRWSVRAALQFGDKRAQIGGARLARTALTAGPANVRAAFPEMFLQQSSILRAPMPRGGKLTTRIAGVVRIFQQSQYASVFDFGARSKPQPAADGRELKRNSAVSINGFCVLLRGTAAKDFLAHPCHPAPVA
jgi:hypothetical protein